MSGRDRAVFRPISALFAAALLLTACGDEQGADQQASAPPQPSAPPQAESEPPALADALPVPEPGSGGNLNVLNWPGYIGKTTVADFEKETGIKVRYDEYESTEEREEKLSSADSDYDVVITSSDYFASQILDGKYQKVDKSKLDNWKNLDPFALSNMTAYDAGHEYAVPYFWGTSGFIYNVDMIRERMPDAPVDSLRMIFDPDVISKFQDCGISFFDAPEDVFPLALAYMRRDPISQNPDDIVAAADLLMKVRPYIKMFDSLNNLDMLAAGELCIGMAWSGDYLYVYELAAAAGKTVNVTYTVPKEGSNLWFDAMLIPKNAPHPDNAHTFINYMMRPKVIADSTNYAFYANGNMLAKQFVAPEILDDETIYPDQETMRRMFPGVVRDDEMQSVIDREWQRFTTGQ